MTSRKNKNRQAAILFHDLLGPASSIRSFLYYVLSKKRKQVDQKTRFYLKECLKNCEELIEKLNKLRENWQVTDQLPSLDQEKPQAKK